MKNIKSFRKLFENEETPKLNYEIDRIIDATEEAFSGEVTPDKYEEDGEVRGFELNTYTDGGVNEVIFIDLRGQEITFENYVKEFEKYVNEYDINERIDMYRQDKLYKQNFTIEESLEDFKSFKENLELVLSKLKRF